jgi:hypothetical protein
MTQEFPGFVPAWRIAAVSHALAGELMEAESAAKWALEIDPSQRVALLRTQMPLRRSEDIERWEEGLTRAAFPE